MAKTRWFVKEPFGDYLQGDVIEDAKLAAEYADYVLRLSDDPAIEPTKAEVRADGPAPAAQARASVGLPSGPVEAKPAERTSAKLKG